MHITLCHLIFWERQVGIDSLEVVSTAEGGRGLQMLACICKEAGLFERADTAICALRPTALAAPFRTNSGCRVRDSRRALPFLATFGYTVTT